MVTDGEKEAKVTEDDLTQLVQTINEHDIKLTCISFDFCNEGEDDDEGEEKVGEEGVVRVSEQEIDGLVEPTQENESDCQVKNKKILLEI